ncbi:4037_t:CDS:2, partial [Gigaspora margarita]
KNYRVSLGKTESVGMYIYYFDTDVEYVKDAIDKNNRICWFISGDINNMNHKAKIIEYKIKIKSELNKVKMDEVENLSDGLLNWLIIIDGHVNREVSSVDIKLNNDIIVERNINRSCSNK